MENFALQTSPCSFLKLRISPWGNLFILLLCFFSPRRLYPFSTPTSSTASSLSTFPLPLSSFHWYRALGPARGDSASGGGGARWRGSGAGRPERAAAAPGASCGTAGAGPAGAGRARDSGQARGRLQAARGSRQAQDGAALRGDVERAGGRRWRRGSWESAWERSARV
jgi:hypothetical protein